MPFSFDFDRMEDLLKSLFTISGLRYSLLDNTGSIMCFSSRMTPFCTCVNDSREGHSRCEQCDAEAIENAGQMKDGYLSYRCHAGLVEAIVPVRLHGESLAYILFGQMAPEGDPEVRWQETRARLDFLDAPDALKEPFLLLQRVSAQMVEGYAKILQACSSYISMEGLVQSAFLTDEQLLNRYIAQNFDKPLTLDAIAAALSMSKTKLCSIAARQGTTVMTMLNNRRMEEAKRMFRHSNDRVSEIAYLVGIRDYNYFNKLFKKYTGETPGAYQKRHRKRA